MKISIRTALVIRMTLVLLAAILVVAAYTYARLQGAADELSNRLIRYTSDQIDSRIGALLDKTEAHAKAVAGLTKPTFQGDSPKSVSSREFPILAAQIVELIKFNPEFSAISVTLDRSGDTVQVSQTPSGGLSVETTEVVQGGTWIRKSWRPFGNRLELVSQAAGVTIDPRREGDYVGLRGGAATTWSETKVLKNLATGPAPGVLCSAPILSANREFLGVASVSLTLSNLSRYVQRIKVSPNGLATLFEYSSGSGARVIADAQLQRVIVTDSGLQRMATIEEIDDPVITKVASFLTETPRMQPSAISIHGYRINGMEQYTGIRRITGDGRPNWALAVTLPEKDFNKWSSEAVYFFTSFLVLSLSVGAALAFLLADRLAKPLQELAEETRRIRSLDFGERDQNLSGISELDDLTDSISTLKTSLRSMEKLVPADYARWLISSGQEAKLGGERRRITTYFADIVGFTRLSHELPPEQLVEVLSEYLDVLSKNVLDLGGTLDKFNGDDVMAFWGAPTVTSDHASVAVTAALKSIKDLESLHADWRESGMPILTASFGIATGDVVVGNVGNKQRMNYTVIGDSVNLASRLQGLNRFHGTHILVSEQTQRESEHQFLWRVVDFVEVFGRNEPTRIYTPLALAGEGSEKDARIAAESAAGLTAYQKRQWGQAITHFEEILSLDPEDGPARILRSRCEEYAVNPPAPNWNGAFEMTMK